MPDGFRTATLADLERIAALERSCFTPADGMFSRRQLRSLLQSPQAHWLLAVDGQAMACWLRAGNGHRRWARLYSLAVHPDARGRGLASQLLLRGFDWMRETGLVTCRAEVKADNAAARRLYAGFGFVETDTLMDYYGPGIDGVRLVRQLGEGKADRRTCCG